MYESKVQIHPILNNIALQYKNDALIGDQLFPTQKVDQQTARFEIYPVITASSTDTSIRAAGTVANEVDAGELSQGFYHCLERALQTAVPDERRKNNVGSKIKPDKQATELVVNRILTGREILAFQVATNASLYQSSLTSALTGTAKWSAAGSDPRKDAMNALTAVHKMVGVEPNTAIIGYRVWKTLQNHPQVIATLGAQKDRFADDATVARVLGVDKIIVSKAQVGSADNTLNNTGSYIWDDSVVFANLDKFEGVNGFGTEFLWGDAKVETWREEPRKSDLIRYSRAYDLRLNCVATDSTNKDKVIGAYLLKGTL